MLPFCFDLAIFHAQQNDLVVQQTHLLPIGHPLRVKAEGCKKNFYLGFLRRHTALTPTRSATEQHTMGYNPSLGESKTHMTNLTMEKLTHVLLSLCMLKLYPNSCLSLASMLMETSCDDDRGSVLPGCFCF